MDGRLMWEAFGQTLPFALVIALSPIPIVAVIATLFSQRAVGNGVAFLLGWVVGVAGGLFLFTALASGQDLGSSATPSNTATMVRLALGLLLLAGAAKSWRGRPGPGDEVQMPRWMAKVDALHPAGAFVLAALLGGVNPKNLLMNIAAAAVLAAASLSGKGDAVVIALYTAVASCTVALAVLYRLVAGARAAATLERMREWLVVNSATIMSVLFLVLGVKLIGDAIAGA
jgi:threonine/homoserine/homoserine lactone efflux protein